MATTLIQIVAFTAVGAGVTLQHAHDINLNDVPTIPDFVAGDTPGFTITVTSTHVSVTNNGLSASNVNVWLELKHSIPRQLGSVQTTNLSPRPFVSSTGSTSGSGGFLPIQTFSVPGPGTTFNAVAGHFNLLDASTSVGEVQAILPAAASVANGTALGIGNYPGLDGSSSTTIDLILHAGDAVNGQTTSPTTAFELDDTQAWLLLISDGVSNWQPISFKF